MTRAIYRHESDEGSVIEIDYWGKQQKIFVPDRKYWGVDLVFDTYESSHGCPKVIASAEYFGGSADSLDKDLGYSRSDVWIQTKYPDLRFDHSSRENTNKLVQSPSTDVAHYCRDLAIPGVGSCDLPNLYTLIVLYLESDRLAALDQSKQDMLFGRFNLNTRGKIWSSSEGSSGATWCINNTGYANAYNQWNYFGVIPVKELNW